MRKQISILALILGLLVSPASAQIVTNPAVSGVPSGVDPSVGSIGSLTLTGKLTQTGVADSTGAIRTPGRVGIGLAVTDNPARALHVSDGTGVPISAMSPGGVQVVVSGTSTAGTIAGIVANNTIAHFPALYLRSIRSRGTFAAPTALQTNDLIGFWESEAYTGSARCPVANIGMFADAVSGSNVGGYTNFLAAASGTCNPVERMRVDSTGVTVASGASFSTPIVSYPASSVLSIASNTIAPTGTVHHVGAGLIKTITVPSICILTCSFAIVPDSAFTTDTTGNVGIASTAVVGRVLIFVWDGTKWWPSY